MNGNEWLIASIGPRTRKTLLLDLIDQVPPEFFGSEPMVVKTKEILINRIRRAQQLYWDAQQADRAACHKPGSAAAKPISRQPNPVSNPLCEISASEVNAFLRSLPVVSPLGKVSP